MYQCDNLTLQLLYILRFYITLHIYIHSVLITYISKYLKMRNLYVTKTGIFFKVLSAIQIHLFCFIKCYKDDF